jgi:hypothetical protein
LNNCAVLQCFGFSNRSLATQWADYFDHSVQQLRDLRPDEQIVSIQGQGEFRCRRCNYLQHEAFRGLYDDNFFYAPTQPAATQENPPARS